MKKNICKLKKSFTLLFIAFCLSVHAQIVNTIAGTGATGYSGDGGSALLADLNLPAAIISDAAGNIYFTDWLNHCVRKIDQNGIITTLAGTGTGGFSGDGGPAILAQLNYPYGICLDAAGNIYIGSASRLRKVDTNGMITTIAGTGSSGFSGDGGPATLAQLNSIANIAVDNLGNIFVADMNNNCVRKIDTSGIISTIAGVGTVGGYSGDGGQAVLALMRAPLGVTVDKTGNLFIADSYNHCIRKVDTSGVITTIAGTGMMGYTGDAGFATFAQLYVPTNVDVDTLGNVYILDELNSCIRKIYTNGIITTIAGTGTAAISPDGGLATNTALFFPKGLEYRDGRIYISDSQSYRIRMFCENHLGINASPNNICVGQTTTLSASGADSYTWSTNDTVTNINVTPSVTTTYSVYTTNNFGCENYKQITIFVALCTNVDEFAIDKSKFTIFPNPVNAELYIDVANANEYNLEIYNALGKLVLNLINCANRSKINIGSLGTGLYYYKVKIPQHEYTGKFVRQD